MRTLPFLLASISLLTGCATPRVALGDAALAQRAAAQSRYWAIQDAHQTAAPAGEFELLSLTRPARTENGIMREASTETIRVPRHP